MLTTAYTYMHAQHCMLLTLGSLRAVSNLQRAQVAFMWRVGQGADWPLDVLCVPRMSVTRYTNLQLVRVHVTRIPPSNVLYGRVDRVCVGFVQSCSCTARRLFACLKYWGKGCPMLTSNPANLSC